MPNPPRERSISALRKQIMESPHYFAVLGVHKQSTPAEFTRARRDLAGAVHPDVCGTRDATDLMAQVNKAYEVLTDDKKRVLYMAELALKECPECHGRGCTVKQRGFTKTVETACKTCRGAGGVSRT